MLEITFTEIVLFAWAVGATAMWLKYRDETKGAKLFIKAILSDDEMRETIVADYKRHMAREV